MKIKRLLSLLLVVLTIFALPCTAFAATLEEPTETLAESSDYFYSDAGVFNTSYNGSFNVSSRTYTSIIVTVKGVSTTENVSVRIYPYGSNSYIVDEIVSADSNTLWHKTLPAGKYEIMLIGGNANYAYSIKIYPYG